MPTKRQIWSLMCLPISPRPHEKHMFSNAAIVNSRCVTRGKSIRDQLVYETKRIGMRDMSNQIRDEPQLEKFKQAARALECDESEPAFKRSLRAIANAPVEKKVKAK